MNYILGGGLTGLLLLEMPQFKDYTLITNKIGGQLSEASFNLGPRILHSSDTVIRFLKDIGITTKPKEFKVGYLVGGGVDFFLNTKEKKEYYRKTRGVNGLNKTCLSENKQFIIGWDIGDINLISVLYRRNLERIKVMDDIVKIDVDKKMLNFDIPYENIVSTLDLQLMYKLLGGDFNVKKKDVYFHYAKKVPDEDLLDMFKLDYLYCIEAPRINRISTTNNKHYRVIESNFSKINSLQYKVEKTIKLNSQLITEIKLETLFGIPLIGRYAQYDHSIKANNIIDKYYKRSK